MHRPLSNKMTARNYACVPCACATTTRHVLGLGFWVTATAKWLVSHRETQIPPPLLAARRQDEALRAVWLSVGPANLLLTLSLHVAKRSYPKYQMQNDTESGGMRQRPGEERVGARERKRENGGILQTYAPLGDCVQQ